MSYSCSDFMDDVVSQLNVDTGASASDPPDDPSELGDLALAEIERLQTGTSLAFDLWAFIENGAGEVGLGNTKFFALRERVRAIQKG